MITFVNCTKEEQDIICKAYEFEIIAIEVISCETNPYFEEVKAMGLWEALNEAIEMAYHKE